MKNIRIVRFEKHKSIFSLMFGNIFLLSVFFLITACNSETSDSDKFDFNLRGTWYSSDPSLYDGQLIIEFNRITILGYEEAQTRPLEDDSRRPFREFTKGTQLSGYSEEDFSNYIIYIRDVGIWHEISCTYYTGIDRNDKFLRFTFGERTETLRYKREY